MKLKNMMGGLIVLGLSVAAYAADMGVKMHMKLERQKPEGVVVNTRTLEMDLWSHFDKSTTLPMADMQDMLSKFDMQLTDMGEQVSVEMKLYERKDGADKVFSAPKLITGYGKEAVIEVGQEGGEMLRIVLLPVKAEQPAKS